LRNCFIGFEPSFLDFGHKKSSVFEQRGCRLFSLCFHHPKKDRQGQPLLFTHSSVKIAVYGREMIAVNIFFFGWLAGLKG